MLFKNVEKKSTRMAGVEFLSENEMFSVRGGIKPPKPTKPISRPRDLYDDEE